MGKKGLNSPAVFVGDAFETQAKLSPKLSGDLGWTAKMAGDLEHSFKFETSLAREARRDRAACLEDAGFIGKTAINVLQISGTVWSKFVLWAALPLPDPAFH